LEGFGQAAGSGRGSECSPRGGRRTQFGQGRLKLIVLQAFSHGERSEEDHRLARRKACRAGNERIMEILLRCVEKTRLPGLSDAIQVKEIGTPLTNPRYNGNGRGAILRLAPGAWRPPGR